MMTPDERPRPQFEPPPWEVEAFERYRREQEQSRGSDELDRALKAVKAADVRAVSPASEPVVLPEQRIEAMFAELRIQEAPAARAGQTLVYSAVAFMGTTGVFMVIAAIVLFMKSKPAAGPGTIVAAMASMVMLLTGAGCIAGAIVLYRKHHQ